MPRQALPKSRIKRHQASTRKQPDARRSPPPHPPNRKGKENSALQLTLRAKTLPEEEPPDIRPSSGGPTVGLSMLREISLPNGLPLQLPAAPPAPPAATPEEVEVEPKLVAW